MKKTFWKITIAAVAVLLTPLAASAGSVYQECSPCAPSCGAAKSKWKVGGWVEMSYYRNAWGQENVYGNDFSTDRNMVTDNSGNTYLLGRNKNADFQANQIWGYVQREMDSKYGFDWGFRADFAYGTDMIYAQAWNDRTWDWNWGEGDYYGSIPRLYAEVGYRNLSVKFGRFDTLLGLETLDAPDNFFISRSYSFYTNPIFTTGVLADYKLGKRATIYAGWINGNDNGFEQRFDDSMITGGIKYALTKKLDLSYMFAVGYEYDGMYQSASQGPEWRYDSHISPIWWSNRHDVYMQTVNLKWKPTKRFTYMLEGTYQQSEFNNTDDDYSMYATGMTKHFGVNNHFIYQLNRKWSLGYRFEWYRAEWNMSDDAGARIDWDGDDFYGHTLALQWKALKHLTITGEIRYDEVFGDGGRDTFRPFDTVRGVGRNHQFSGGISAIIHY